MTVVDDRPPRVESMLVPEDPINAELLFKEARRRERRRRLIRLGVVILVVGAAVAILVSTGPPAKPSRLPPGVASPGEAKSTGLPVGAFASLNRAGPLAVSPTGALYVADDSRHEILVRLASGRFRVVAGDGREGFSGDGGPAIDAELSAVSDLAFAPDGDLYIADGTRVRVVDLEGTIRTIAGDGRTSGAVADDTSALSAALGPVTAIAFSPGGQLYLASSSQLFAVTPSGGLDSLRAVLPPGEVQMPGALDDYGSIAVDGGGNVYASSTFDGWSVFKISPDGVATYLGYSRRSGGNTAIVQRGTEDVIEVDDGSTILQVVGDQLVPSLSITTVPGIDGFTFTDYFAAAPDGSIYADNLGPPAFEPDQQIISVSGGHGVSLWRGDARR
jgi:hypothetical protein